MPADPTCLAVVPIRSFDDTKTRLAAALTPAERSALTRELATGVLDALAAASPVVVVTDDPVVGAWASRRDVPVVGAARAGLDGAADAGRARAAADGHGSVAVVHADLAAPDALAAVLTRPLAGATVRIVPDRHRDGTNVLVLPTDGAFTFGYGPGSFERHRAEAERRGLVVEVVDEPDLGWDVDEVDDLAHFRALQARA